MAEGPQTVTTAGGDGAARLAERVLAEEERGTGYFYPATPSGQPLALAGFAIALAMLSIANADIYTHNATPIMVAVAGSIGFVALTLAGMWDFRANNLFGAVWDVAYACFWLSLVLAIVIAGPLVIAAAGAPAFGDAFGTYLIIFGVFTTYMTVGAYYIARPAFLAFLLLAAVFYLTGVSNVVSPGDTADNLRKIGGWVGIADAAVAMYLSAALVINTQAGRTILPLWPYPYGSR